MNFTNNMTELLNDPDFVTDFVLKIAGGDRLADGRFVEKVTCHNKSGVIQPAPSKETQYLTEGDRYRHAIKIWSCEYLSAVDSRVPQLGDILGWHCADYRIVSVKDWSEYGYWQAMAVQLLDKEK